MYNLKPNDHKVVDLDGKVFLNVTDLYDGKKVIIVFTGNLNCESVVTLKLDKHNSLTYELEDEIGVVSYTEGQWKAVGSISNAPQVLPDDERNPQDLISVVQEYVEYIEKNKYEMKDGDHWIFEAAIEYVYGKEIWKWIGGKL